MLRLPPFDMALPTTIEEAIAELATPGAELIAGGTDLLPNMKHRIYRPKKLVSLDRIAALREFADDKSANELRIGCLATLADVARHEVVRASLPSLEKAAGHAASPPIRHSATLGGNLNLEPRCKYVNQTEFWRGSLGGCLKCDGDVCHVVSAGKKCVAAVSSDCTPVLISLDATIELVGPEGKREMPLADYYRGDGISNTVRLPGEVLTCVRVPLPSGPRRTAYARWAVRGAIDFPLVSAAIRLDLDGEGPDGKVTDTRVVVGALVARPKTVTKLDDLAGRRLNDADLPALIAERVFEQCKPMENIPYDAAYRRQMLKVHTRRAIEEMATS
jgi:4-hydroxybenzoyl-CoA reductase subunit beta